ncbi:V-type ATPase subunit subunit G family protein [Methanoregula sp.]|uniref:V-type ATPase subunit subunit G family protein n=1 Tax=Methanoregula sp. TaxID=2052170 RepID=UPI003BAF872F
MDAEKSLLQQIRDREREFAIKVETAKRETEAEITAAHQQAETIITEATKRGKTAAEELLNKETIITGAEVDRIKKEAADKAEAVRKNGEMHLQSAVAMITGYVINR